MNVAEQEVWDELQRVSGVIGGFVSPFTGKRAPGAPQSVDAQEHRVRISASGQASLEDGVVLLCKAAALLLERQVCKCGRGHVSGDV
jgi:hypothetical protein